MQVLTLGHRYRIEVGVDDKIITTSGASDEGMIIDFSDLKQIMMEEIDAKFDHSLIISSKDPLCEIILANRFFDNQKIVVIGEIPTAEKLAMFWFKLLKPQLAWRKIKLKYVKVWETPTSTAEYSE